MEVIVQGDLGVYDVRLNELIFPDSTESFYGVTADITTWTTTAADVYDPIAIDAIDSAILKGCRSSQVLRPTIPDKLIPDAEILITGIWLQFHESDLATLRSELCLKHPDGSWKRMYFTHPPCPIEVKLISNLHPGVGDRRYSFSFGCNVGSVIERMWYLGEVVWQRTGFIKGLCAL